jgi:hypothetical protein
MGLSWDTQYLEGETSLPFHVVPSNLTPTAIVRQFSDIRKLPSLVPSHIRNATAQAVGHELDRRIKRLSNMIDSGSVESDSNSNGQGTSR